MSGDRTALKMPPVVDDLDDFAPRAGQGDRAPLETKRAVDQVASFPSREAGGDIQLNLKGPRHVLERFKAMAREDRRSFWAMLEILMDAYEGKSRGTE